MKINDGISHGGSSAGKSQRIALRSLPSYNGKNYIDVNSVIYISSVSPNADLAADYLAYMVSDDYMAERYNYDKSLLVKDFDSYFWYSNGGLPEQYKYKKEPLTLYVEGMYGYYQSSIYTKDDKFLVENGADLFYNAAPRLYTYGMDDFLEAVYDGLAEGGLTIEEAADKIYSESKYRLME